jgi:hypothetical protein
MYRWIRRILIGLVALIGILVIVLAIYARDPYTPISSQADALDAIETTAVRVETQGRTTVYDVDDPIAHILFLPGGLVTPDSYAYLAYSLATNGYRATVFHPYFHLAILTPWIPSNYLDDTLDNIVIGHSLGGTVASLVASGDDRVSTIVFLASYPIQDVSDKRMLLITAEQDTLLDADAVEDSRPYWSNDAVTLDLTGGNHAQFGWYGPQEGDGEATIDTLTQQTQVVAAILNFLQP